MTGKHKRQRRWLPVDWRDRLVDWYWLIFVLGVIALVVVMGNIRA